MFPILVIVGMMIIYLAIQGWIEIGINAAAKSVQKSNQKAKADKAYQDDVHIAQRSWDQRVSELHIDTNNPIVHLQADNDDSIFFPMYVWMDDDITCLFVARPGNDKRDLSQSLYPENYNIHKFKVAKIQRERLPSGVRVCKLEYSNGTHNYFREDDYDTFHQIMPNI